MKQLIAFIKPHKLDDVMLALHRIEGLTGASISDVRGFGRDRSKQETNQEPKVSMEVKTHVKLEIFCMDDLVDEVVSTIESSAHTGLRGDGKIYISHVEQAIRISNGERGEAAV
ncbi:MAG: P-II family nitrogen regulator [Candidatus Zixiibacteriota bacterium]|nr:MAG: P-II family nitrogen regulator [candidate division Zixibacteria bacterium]